MHRIFSSLLLLVLISLWALGFGLWALGFGLWALGIVSEVGLCIGFSLLSCYSF